MPTFTTAAHGRKVRPPTDAAAALAPLIESRDRAIRSEAVKLAGEWKISELQKPIESLALDHGSEALLRRAAVEALGNFGDSASRSNLLRLAKENSPEVQGAAIVALAESDVLAAAKLAPPVLAGSGEHAQDIFAALLGREGGAAALEKSLAANRPSKAAAEIGLRLMNAGGKRHDTLAKILAEAAGLSTDDIPVTDMVAFIAEVRASGNAQRGAQIFRRPELGCMACHSVNGEGGNIGPDLSALGTAQPLDFIVGAILQPQKEIKEGYTSVSITTKDGHEHQGYVLREKRDEIVLRDVLQNKEVRVRRDTIKEKRANGSVMPEGLVNILRRDEFRDLVRYLGELGAAKPK